MTKEEFIAAATAAAQAASATSGFPPGVTVAQAALESAWGNSQLAQVANNYFGVKARRGSEAVELPTIEYVDGAPVRVPAKFAKYASMAECFADRDRMIASFSRVPGGPRRGCGSRGVHPRARPALGDRSRLRREGAVPLPRAQARQT